MTEAINDRCQVHQRPDGTWGMEVDGETVPAACVTRESALHFAESVMLENDHYAKIHAERVAAGCRLIDYEQDPMDDAMGYSPPGPYCSCAVCFRERRSA